MILCLKYSICMDRKHYKHSFGVYECLYPNISAENTALLPNWPQTAVVYPL